MKNLITLIALLSTTFSFAQNINWSTIQNEQKQLAYLNFGYDFSTNTQIGYAFKANLFKPILISLDYSFPMGNQLVDDYKMRLGGQLPLFQKNNFILSAKAYGNFRRHETSMVRMASFGSEIGSTLGLYKKTWHLALELGFDKAISTQLKHSSLMKENFPNIKDGWAVPTSGQYYYGIQGSKKVGSKFELSLKAGATNAQFKDQNALLPYYAGIGILYKIKTRII